MIWIPSHVGTPGNEKADIIANAAINEKDCPIINTLLGKTEAYTLIKRYINAAWETEWQQIIIDSTLQYTLPSSILSKRRLGIGDPK